MDAATRQAWLGLQALPNIGPAMADDLIRLGIRTIGQVAKADARKLYDRISEMDGIRHDPCVLDTFEAAIHAARTGEAVPWWEFSRRRKATATAGSKS
jgi:DNA transformation protein